jgi:hypothetical protein
LLLCRLPPSISLSLSSFCSSLRLPVCHRLSLSSSPLSPRLHPLPRLWFCASGTSLSYPEETSLAPTCHCILTRVAHHIVQYVPKASQPRYNIDIRVGLISTRGHYSKGNHNS